MLQCVHYSHYVIVSCLVPPASADYESTKEWTTIHPTKSATKYRTKSHNVKYKEITVFSVAGESLSFSLHISVFLCTSQNIDYSCFKVSGRKCILPVMVLTSTALCSRAVVFPFSNGANEKRLNVLCYNCDILKNSQMYPSWGLSP